MDITFALGTLASILRLGSAILCHSVLLRSSVLGYRQRSPNPLAVDLCLRSMVA